MAKLFDHRRVCNLIAPVYDTSVRLAARLVGGEEEIRRLALNRLLIQPGDRLVELGCGTATLSVMAGCQGAAVAGVDMAERMLDMARKKAAAHKIKAEFIQANITEAPYPDGHFQKLIISLALHEQPNLEIIRNVLEEAKRLLVPGGRGVIMDYHLPDGFRRAVMFLFLFLAERRQARPLINLDLSGLLASLGFENIEKSLPAGGTLQLLSFKKAAAFGEG